MPLYNYICANCLKKATKIKGSPLTQEEEMDNVVFETKHAMVPTPDEIKATTKCPRCGSNKTSKIFAGIETYGYVRGKAFLDKAGMKRDMNLYKLTQKDENGKSTDPYGHMREPGEADDLAHRIRKAGQKTVKKQVFDVGKKPSKRRK